MATQRQKNTRPAAHEPGAATRPAWKQPPPKPRKQMRRNQTAAPRTATPAARSHLAPDRSAPRPRLRIGANARRYARATLLLLVVAGCVAGGIALLRLPPLTVTATSIQIGGSRRIALDTIYQTSELEGRSILLVRPSEVAAAVAGIQGLAGADVHVRLPNQVLIDVREYAPLVAWQGITTTVWLAADGMEVPQVGDPPPLKLNDRTGTPLGTSREIWQYLLPELVELHQARPDLGELFYGKMEGLYFITAAGWTAWLGDHSSMQTKLDLLEAAQREIAVQDAHPQVIDLRSDEGHAFWW